MKKQTLAILIIAVIAIGVGAFYGGMAYEKKQQKNQRVERSGNSGDRMIQGKGQNVDNSGVMPRGFSRNGKSGQFATGEVISKDDKSVTIKTREGGSKIIYFSDSTQISKLTDGNSDDLENGKELMINGKANQDGSITAESIQIRPSE